MRQQAFRLVETTIADIYSAYRGGTLTARRLVQMYLDRIESYDTKGPSIYAVIALNPKAIEDADRRLRFGRLPLASARPKPVAQSALNRVASDGHSD